MGVSARLIHQLWAPGDDAYSERREIEFGSEIAAIGVEGLVIATSGI